MFATVTVAADSSCSRADGGRIILSPLRGGVNSGGSTSNWVDQFSDGRSRLVFIVDRAGEAQRLAVSDVAS